MKIKIILTFIILLFLINRLNCQTIVPTTPQPRNVLLEEFTGINCGSCPYAHAIIADFHNDYPNRFYSIAYHVGSSAMPLAGQPDYRTDYGYYIENQTGLVGYPSGTVNRHVFPGLESIAGHTAMYKEQWDDAINIIMQQIAPVNIAINAQFNYITRTLDLLVEVYYTSNADSSINKLNVALVQNYVKGPQAELYHNSSFIAPDGQYYHMQMFRDFITGQWGIDIPHTTTGSFYDTIIHYQIPTNFYNIPVDLSNLEIIAFVCEGRQEVLNATSVQLPRADFDIAALHCYAPHFTCNNISDISLLVKNKGYQTISSLDISYKINNGMTHTIHWSDNLSSDSLINITIPNISLNTGLNNIKIWTENPNNNIDKNPINDTANANINVFHPDILPPYLQDFSSITFPPSTIVITDNQPDGKTWQRDLASYENVGSAKIEFYYIQEGNTDDLILHSIDLSNYNNPTLSFYRAYRQYDGYITHNDMLQIDLSTDCGNSWNTIWSKGDSALATGIPMMSSFTDPLSDEWQQEIISLINYKQTNVIIRFRAISDNGNNLFIDNIKIDENNSIADKDYPPIIIYPNPADDKIILKLSNNYINSIINIYDSKGQCIYEGNYETNKNITCDSWPNGIYFIMINNEIENNINKIIVQH